MTPPLFIIDVQHGFLNAHTAHVPALAEPLQARYAQVFVTRFVNPPGSPYRRIMGWRRFAPGSDDTGLAVRPAPHASVLDKSVYTCLAPALLEALRADNVEEVHLAGIATDNCVLKTAVDLFEAGIRPVVLGWACASHAGPEHHAAGLMLLRRFIGAAQIEDYPA
jgi:nicotinamidase-related amidase